MGKSHAKWQTAVEAFVDQVTGKANEILNNGLREPGGTFVRDFAARAERLPLDRRPWAKFPDLVVALAGCDLPDPLKRSIKKALEVPFRPGIRHEAASALAAWEQWQHRADGWTALAVYLVACHHGKVRTALRNTGTGDNVFGVGSGDVLPALAEWSNSDHSIGLGPRIVGAVGSWDGDAFYAESPSWTEMVAELLGPELLGDPDAGFAVPEDEPRSLGPFRLAFLEALIRAADVKASRNPGKGIKS
jgi:hypothetical protein